MRIHGLVDFPRKELCPRPPRRRTNLKFKFPDPFESNFYKEFTHELVDRGLYASVASRRRRIVERTVMEDAVFRT